MAKKLIKRFLPHPRIITNNRLIKLLGPRLQDPGLWHINRKSFCGAVAIGVFFSFIPVPFQMLLAAVSAPSSLAVQLAQEFNMSLVGFLRGDTFNIYAGEERITE